MLEELSDDEVERLATEFYEHDLRATLEATHPNAFVAIEPVSRTYYIGNTLSEAGRQARLAFPDRLSFAVRVGHSAAIHIGGIGACVQRNVPDDKHVIQVATSGPRR